jgi:hypothetical protein
MDRENGMSRETKDIIIKAIASRAWEGDITIEEAIELSYYVEGL